MPKNLVYSLQAKIYPSYVTTSVVFWPLVIQLIAMYNHLLFFFFLRPCPEFLYREFRKEITRGIRMLSSHEIPYGQVVKSVPMGSIAGSAAALCGHFLLLGDDPGC